MGQILSGFGTRGVIILLYINQVAGGMWIRSAYIPDRGGGRGKHLDREGDKGNTEQYLAALLRIKIN